MSEVIADNHRQLTHKSAEIIDGGLLLNKFRLRVCKSADVPILMDFSGLRQTDVLLIDHPVRENNEEQIGSDVKQHPCADSTMKEEEEGFDGPLIFDFLSLAKLEERCNADSNRFRGHHIIVSTTHFDCNPLASATAFDLRNKLMSSNASSILDKNLLNLPIWIAANAEDNLGTTFVGFHFSNGKLSTSHTRCLGRFGEECEVTLNNLLQRFGDGLETRSKAMALYRILGKNVSSAWGPGRLLSSMTLTFRWETKAENYLSSPSPSATAIFHFSPGWKDKRIALLENTEELEYLLLMACVLDSGATMIWPPSGENTHNSIMENVNQLIAQYRVQNNEQERTVHGMRHVDFTELLWDILKKCGKLETLVAALNIVFDALKQCRINAILHEDNKSTIARLIRDAQSRNLMLPRLEALTSIQILLEIGVERFRSIAKCILVLSHAALVIGNAMMDLHFLYSLRWFSVIDASTDGARNSGLEAALDLVAVQGASSNPILRRFGAVRRDMVQAYVAAGFMTSDSDLDLKPQPNASPEERARALLPLHLALQTMLEMKRHLTLPAHMLTTMTRSVINKYCSSPITDVTKVFYETVVPLIHVQPDLLQRLPDLWTNETVYSHGNSLVASTLAHFTRDPQLRFLEGKASFNVEETEENQKLEKYSTFLCTYTTSSFLNAEDMEEWN